MANQPSREQQIFNSALPLATREERAAYLKVACAGDAALQQRVEALFQAHDQADNSPDLDVTVKSAPSPSPPVMNPLTEKPGDRIGRYKLLERIGEGGCGVVYVAEQTEPVRRRVAIKVIKLGMDTKQVIARFEAERQALALMDHPNIARVLDAGATDTGRPFFVMELVRGVPITEYCDQNNLSTHQRLDLFIKVCQAIQHAHQKGIIHRDIKPSNILVTLHDGVPVPKVIDFGIAKATEGRLTDATVYTQLHQFVGTPAYMSPEQAEMSGLDIDTRSDIYSLGVLLYELLTGRTPFDPNELVSQGIDAMRKTIREKEPLRPSTRFATLQGEELTTTAKRRSTDTSKLMHQLRGDLDWIAMKCLEKDRTRRYETANGLAADLKRHLNNETVVARPPSSAYRFQKLVRRNKVAFAAGVAIAVALLLGIIVSTWQAVRATQAKRDALAAQASESVQRQKAEADEQKAVQAQAEETRLRRQAEAAELAARQRAYASDMNVAKQQLDGNNLGRALDLLNRQRPGPGQRDLRGWEWRYLWQQTRSDALFTLCQEPSEIYSLAVSPDGNWLAIGTFQKGDLAVWDLRTRQELTRLAKDETHVRAIFSPTEPLLAFTSSALLASGEWRDTLRLWNTATHQMMAELPLDHQCIGLAFAEDGRTLVTSTIGGHITLWGMPDGTRMASYPSELFAFGPQCGFAATRDLSIAACGLTGGRIRVTDLRDGKELWTAVASKGYITALAFSPDGRTLASAGGYSESDIRLWDVATGKQIGQLEGHGSYVISLMFWPDGKELASSGTDQTIRTWDVASQKCLDVLRGHRLEVWRLALLPDGKTLVSGAKDGTVCFWDTSVVHPHQPRITLPAENVVRWSFAADGRSILTLDEQGRVAQWTGADFEQPAWLMNLGTNLYSACFSPDGRFLAVNWTNGMLRVWDPSQRVLLHQLTNTTGHVSAQNLLADGTKLITWSESGNLLQEWDLTTGVKIQSWPAPVQLATSVLAPDERSCMAIGRNGNVVLRNLADESQPNLELDAPETDVGSFSPDGKLFAVASSLGYARVWDATSWGLVANLKGFLKGVHAVGFSPDSKRLTTGSGDNEAVRLWDTESWQDVFTLEAPGTGLKGMQFSPDGNAIIWGSQSALYLWRAPSWAEIKAAEEKEKESRGDEF